MIKKDNDSEISCQLNKKQSMCLKTVKRKRSRVAVVAAFLIVLQVLQWGNFNIFLDCSPVFEKKWRSGRQRPRDLPRPKIDLNIPCIIESNIDQYNNNTAASDTISKIKVHDEGQLYETYNYPVFKMKTVQYYEQFLILIVLN